MLLRLALPSSALAAVLLLAGCGARTLPLGPGAAPGDGGTVSGDGSVRQDAGPRPPGPPPGFDAGPPTGFDGGVIGRDSGPMPPPPPPPPPPGRDGGRPSLPCRADPPIAIVTRPGTLSYPAVANMGGQALLIWARENRPGRASNIESLPITPDGMPAGTVNTVAPGDGGTLVAVPAAHAYILLLHMPDGSVEGVPLGLDGLPGMTGMPVPANTDSKRPAVAVGATSYAVGWNQPGGRSIALVAHSMSMAGPMALMLSGHDPWIVGSTMGSDDYRVSSFSGNRIAIRTFDINAHVLHRQTVRESGEQIVAAHVLKSPMDDAVAMLSFPTSSMTASRIRILRGTLSQLVMVEGFPTDLGAAIDPYSSFILAAYSTNGDTGAPNVGAVISAGRSFNTYSLATVPNDAHPAVMNDGPASFLVVWEDQSDPAMGAIMGARVWCDLTTG